MPCSPASCVLRRLDTVETIGAVLDGVVDGPDGVRPAAKDVNVPHTTARGWVRRFCERAERLAVAFAALASIWAGRSSAPSSRSPVGRLRP